MSDNIRNLIELGKPFLKQYLLENKVEFKKKGSNEFFSCIHPDHDDKNPSASIMKASDGEIFHCFSCAGGTGDIYTAAHFLEDKPLYGIGFIRDNVEYILQKFGVEFTPLDITEEQLSKYKYESVYESATKLLIATDKTTGKYLYSTTEHAGKRGWGDSICRSIGIGTIKDFDIFIEALSKTCNIPAIELINMGITDNLFGPDLITFTVRDHNGFVKGYAARYLKWEEGCGRSKYVNTSLERNPYYRKDQLLFGLDIAKKCKDLRLDIFEGYGSLVTAQQAGHRNCCSIGGTALTESHVDIIRYIGFKHINLVLDMDSTGTEKMNRYIDKFSGYNGLEVTIMALPIKEEDLKQYGQNDPDFFIQNYGLEAYRGVKPIDLFEHMLNKYPKFDSSDPMALQFCKKMIPLIINQPDYVRRGKMISSLAAHTSTDKDDIRLEISRLEKSDVKSLKDDLSRKIKNASDPDQIHDILSSAMNNLDDTSSTKKDRYLISIAESIEVCDEIFKEMNSASVGLHGWDTGYPALNEIMDGIPKPAKTGGRIFGIAGAPQHSKSAILMNVALNIALNSSDVSILFWAIDDHRKSIFTRLVSILSEVHIKKVTKVMKADTEELKAIKNAQELIRQLTIDRKLVFKDDRLGRSKSKIETWIKETQDNSGKDILLCIDSLHNISGGDDLRVKVLSSSTWAKSLTASIPCSVMSTIELIKNKQKGVKPTLQDVAETAKIEYDFDTLGIAWNEAQGNYMNVGSVQAKWGSPGNWKPIIELDIQKNKAGSGEKGSVFFRFDTDTTKLVSASRTRDDLVSEFSDIGEVVGDRGTVYNFVGSMKNENQDYNDAKW